MAEAYGSFTAVVVKNEIAGNVLGDCEFGMKSVGSKQPLCRRVEASRRDSMSQSHNRALHLFVPERRRRLSRGQGSYC